MAKFLSTTAINYFLEDLVKKASSRLILITPYLKLNKRMKELLEDKDRLKIDVRIVYGKSDLQPLERAWLEKLVYVRTSFLKDLRAKCYMNESSGIITSMNLYEFSQINNNEMGTFFTSESDGEFFREASEEAQRYIRMSEELKKSDDAVSREESEVVYDVEGSVERLSSSKLAKKLGMMAVELMEAAVSSGHFVRASTFDATLDAKKRLRAYEITSKGSREGIRIVTKSVYGPYFLWPSDFRPN